MFKVSSASSSGNEMVLKPGPESDHFVLPSSRYTNLSAHRLVKHIFNQKSLSISQKIQLAKKAINVQKTDTVFNLLLNNDYLIDERPLLDASMARMRHRPVTIINPDGTECHGVSILRTSVS